MLELPFPKYVVCLILIVSILSDSFRFTSSWFYLILLKSKEIFHFDSTKLQTTLLKWWLEEFCGSCFKNHIKVTKVGWLLNVTNELRFWRRHLIRHISWDILQFLFRKIVLCASFKYTHLNILCTYNVSRRHIIFLC